MIHFCIIFLITVLSVDFFLDNYQLLWDYTLIGDVQS
jgi:hypothetical protein